MNTTSMPDTAHVFPCGAQLHSPYFSGRVWLNMLVAENNPLQCPIGYVTFEPGCRNHWHRHPGGQILLVTEGCGLYQERGKAAQALRSGDTVVIGSGVEHWHGATPDSWFAHLAITTQPQAGAAEWLTPVTATEYEAATSTEQA